MSVELLPLCSVGKAADRDGGVGPNARVMLPFYEFGYWYPDGKQYDFGSDIGQDLATYTHGSRQADTFIKAYGVCLQS